MVYLAFQFIVNKNSKKLNNQFTILKANDKIKKKCKRGEQKMKRKLKKVFSLYNIGIALGVILVLISAYLILKPKGEIQTKADNEVKVIQSSDKNKEYTEKDVRKIAIKQCKELKEKSIKESELHVVEFKRDGEDYYYISSKENTIEIKKIGGIITKINSVPVAQLNK